MLDKWIIQFLVEEREMIDKATKKKLKKIQREIKKAKKELDKVELRPCQNDADLKRKEDDLKDLADNIRALEHEQDRHILDTGKVKHTI
jgi:peroxiredoxin family protein